MDHPKLHFIYDGEKSPLWALQHAEAWKQYADVLLWTESDLKAEIGREFDEICERIESPRFRANWARHWLMFHHGEGPRAWADWDSEPMENPFRLDDWGDAFVIASHPVMTSQVDNCFMYVSEAGNAVAGKILDRVDFTKLTAKQITILTNKNQANGERIKLPGRWNRNRDLGEGSVINHYYMGASLDAKEMAWLMPKFEGRKVVECGTGLRSIEFNEICDLVSIENEKMFADRAIRGGCEDVVLESDLDVYSEVFASRGVNAEIALIDGRRRDACLGALAKVNESVRIYVHDVDRDGVQMPNGWSICEVCDESKRGLIAIEKD